MTYIPGGCRVGAGGKPSQGTPKDKRLKQNKTAKVTRAGALSPATQSIRQQNVPEESDA